MITGNSPSRLTPRPPRGWNSYDCYGCSANQRVSAANLKAFAERLVPAGYEFFVLDNGWFGEYHIEAGEEFTREKHAATVRLDEFGRLLPSEVSFPQGFAPLIDQAHRSGIKFGLHLMRGVPRQAVVANLPIAGTNFRAVDIADTSDTCNWCDYMYGVDMRRPGAQAYYDSVFKLFAEWGLDFVKVDDVIHKPREIEAVANAIQRCGRDIVLSLSPGDHMDPQLLPTFQRANFFRITGDVWDRQVDIDKGFARWEVVQNLPLNGLWPDLDMIPFGQLMVWNPATREECLQLCGHGVARRDQFTPAQRRTFITQRALAASPLFMGGELTMSDPEVFDLITNPRMLECNGNGIVGRLIHRRDGIDIWQTKHRGRSNAGWLGIFNRTPQPRHETIDLNALGLNQSMNNPWSIWDDRPVKPRDGRIEYDLGANDVLFMSY